MLRICYGLRWTVVRCEKLSKVIFHAWNFKPCLVFYGDIVSADANAYVVADVNSVVVGDLSAAADTNAVADVKDVSDANAVADVKAVSDANAVADVKAVLMSMLLLMSKQFLMPTLLLMSMMLLMSKQFLMPTLLLMPMLLLMSIRLMLLMSKLLLMHFMCWCQFCWCCWCQCWCYEGRVLSGHQNPFKITFYPNTLFKVCAISGLWKGKAKELFLNKTFKVFSFLL